MVIGAMLFVVDGQDHAFDEPVFLGDPVLEKVELAWSVLERTVKTAITAKASY